MLVFWIGIDTNKVMDAALAVQEFLEYVVTGLVSRPEEARVDREEVDGAHHYLIRLPLEEATRVIGKGGKTVAAIRGLVAASAEKHGIRASVEVEEGG